MIVDETDYFDKMENLLNGTCKFEKISRKKDELLSFAVNQGNHTGNVLQKLFSSYSISEETKRSLTLVVTRPGLMYGLYVNFTKV